MSARMDWRKAKAGKDKRPRKRAREVEVHPNSMAARKWGRKTWRSTVE